MPVGRRATIEKVFERLVAWGLAACLGAMTCSVIGGVVFRSGLNTPLPWSEELASWLFIWLTCVGAVVGVRSRSHVGIDTLVVSLSPLVRRELARVVDAGVLGLLVRFAWQGFSLTVTTWGLAFPAMETSRDSRYASLLVGACLMIVVMLERWRGRSPGTPTGGEHA